MNTETNAAPEDRTIDGAIVEVKASTELVAIDPAKYAAAAFESYKKEFQVARRAATKAGSFDITTGAGMKQARELRASFRSIRTAIENARKAAKAPVIEAGKKIDEVARDFTAEVLPHETKYDQLIDAEEKRKEAEKQAKLDAERARIEAIENRIAHLRGIPQQMVNADSITIATTLESMATMRLEPTSYDEHLNVALDTLNQSVDALRDLHQKALDREAEQRRVAAERAELELLRQQRLESERRAKAEEAERERLAQEERTAAAEREAAMQRQQNQMTAIMLLQGLPFSIIEQEKAGDHAIVTAALKKVRAFEPGDFGDMAPMARIARDTALPMLEKMFADLPADPVADAQSADLIEQQMQVDTQVLIDQPVNAVSPVIIDDTSAEPYIPAPEPRKVIPAPPRPSDLDIVQAMSQVFSVTAAVAIGWIETVDASKVRAALAEV